MSPISVGVVGGGALGLTAAVELARRGASVTLFERDEPGSGATGRAAGLCYDAYAGKRDADVAARSIDRFCELDLLTECPYLWFAREDDGVADAIESQARRMQEIGREISVIGPDDVATRFPALVTEDIAIAAVAENAGVVDPDGYIDEIALQADREGAQIRTGEPATVTRDGGIRVGGDRIEFDAVLVTAGARTEQVLAGTGIELAVGLYRTQALTAAVGSLEGGLPMYYDATEELYARPTAEGVLAGDGSHIYDGTPADYRREADEAFLDERMAGVNERVDADLTRRESWAGLCTATPDRNPLLGKCAPGIYVGTGFCGHGFMRAPALGERLAKRILGDEGIDAFDPLRFDGDEAVDLPVGIVD